VREHLADLQVGCAPEQSACEATEVRGAPRFVPGGIEAEGFHPWAGRIVGALRSEALEDWRARELALLAATNAPVLAGYGPARIQQAASYLLDLAESARRENHADVVAFNRGCAALPRVVAGGSPRVGRSLAMLADWLGGRAVLRSDVVAVSEGVAGRASFALAGDEGLVAVVSGMREQPTWTDLANAAVFASGAIWTGARWQACERAVIVSVNGSVHETEMPAERAKRIVAFVAAQRSVLDAGAIFDA
jgi:hypothetical protein